MLYEYIAPFQQAHGTLIWLHGLGGNAFEYYDFGKYCANTYKMHVYLLHADERAIKAMDGTLTHAWYDLYYDAEKLSDHKASLLNMVHRLDKFLQAIQPRVKNLPIIIGGFSQGATTALSLVLEKPVPLQGLILCSAWLPSIYAHLHKRSRLDLQSMHVLSTHGAQDNIVPYQEQQKITDIFQHINVRITTYNEPSTAHTISITMMHQIKNYIRSFVSVPTRDI